MSDASKAIPRILEGLDPSLEVTSLPSGLQYVEIRAGKGTTPRSGQTCSVHYTGWLLDGTKFDSSLDRGQVFEFPLGQGRVIRGWDEAVALMNVGDKWRISLPPELAYGDRGVGPIPPASTLIFDVELKGFR